MNENILISLIIPVYNVERYLNKCLESIVSQTYKNIEIILVDDGSIDKSGEMCDEWAKKDGRVKVIHKINGGLSDARNKGIHICSGEYLTCIDSDDYVTSDFIEILVKNATDNNSDISICGTFVLDENGNEYFSTKNKNTRKEFTLTPEKAIEAMLYGVHFSNSAWGKLYRKKLFEGVEYPYRKLYEDLYTTHKLFYKANRISFTAKKGYNYLIRKSGISGTSDAYKRMEAVIAEYEIIEFIRNNNLNILFSARYKLMTDSMKVISLFDFNNITKEDEKLIAELWENVKNARFKTIFSSKTLLKYKILSIISYLGKKKFNKIYNKIIKGI